MKDWIKLLVCFMGWTVILLTAFALLVIAVAPGMAVSKPLLFIASLAVTITRDAVFVKRHTSATGG